MKGLPAPHLTKKSWRFCLGPAAIKGAATGIKTAKAATIILTTHYLEEAESLCRNVAVINEGVVIQQGAVSHLLSESYAQTYVLDISQSMDTAPDLEGFSVYLLGNQQLEVEVTKEHHLNKLFAVLSSKKLDVTSMRTKTNRLEEFFMRLVKKG